MTTKNKQKQIELLSNLIDELTKAKNELFDICESQTIGMTTNKANELFNENFSDTQKALYNATSIIAQRYYELNQIKDNEL